MVGQVQGAPGLSLVRRRPAAAAAAGKAPPAGAAAATRWSPTGQPRGPAVDKKPALTTLRVGEW